MKLEYTIYKVGVDTDKEGNIMGEEQQVVVLTLDSFTSLLSKLDTMNYLLRDQDLFDSNLDETITEVKETLKQQHLDLER